MDSHTIIVSEISGEGAGAEVARFVSIHEAMRFAEQAQSAGRRVMLHREGVKPPKLDLWGHLRKGARMAGEVKSRHRRDHGDMSK